MDVLPVSIQQSAVEWFRPRSLDAPGESVIWLKSGDSFVVLMSYADLYEKVTGIPA